jgi:hypothetical protein
MNDAGAHPYVDFTFLGHPSTYLLSTEELLSIFHRIDLKYANNPKNFWVVEFADGIFQRETAILLSSPEVTSRIHKLIFCASDGMGGIGGIEMLKEKFNLRPDLLSGIFSSSPLHIMEVSSHADIPVFNNMDPDIKLLKRALCTVPRPRGRNATQADPMMPVTL